MTSPTNPTKDMELHFLHSPAQPPQSAVMRKTRRVAKTIINVITDMSTVFMSEKAKQRYEKQRIIPPST